MYGVGDFVWLNVGKVFHGIYQLTYVFLVLCQLDQMFGENSSSSRRQCFPSAEPGNEVPRSVQRCSGCRTGPSLQETVWRD